MLEQASEVDPELKPKSQPQLKPGPQLKPVAKPVDPKAADAKAADSKSADAKPAETRPVDIKQANTKPPGAPVADGTDSVRHLNYADLEAYMAGRGAADRLQHCRTHLETCDACRAELEDLRTLRADQAAFARPESAALPPSRKKKHNGIGLHVTAATGIVLVAGVAAFFWWSHNKGRLSQPSVAATVKSTVSSAPAEVHKPPVASPPAAPAAPDTPALAAAATHAPAAQAAANTAHVIPTAHPITVSAQPADAIAPGDTEFALLSPLGETVAETRPEFRWQPLAGATRYSVTIVDEGLHPVQHSPKLHATSWRPPKSLGYGQTYRWQVTATLRDGSTVVATESSQQQAIVRILPHKMTDELDRFRKEDQDNHLVLGVLYAQAGMLSESAEELKKVPPGDSFYNAAQKLLGTLPPPAPAPKPH